MDVWGILERARRLHGGELAVIDGALRYDYATLHARAISVAAFFRSKGVCPGDRLAILAPNGSPFLETYFAAAALGAILCPLNVRLAGNELAAILVDAGPRWLVADEELDEIVRSALAAGAGVEGVLWIGDGGRGAVPVASSSYSAALASNGAGFVPHAAKSEETAHLYYTSGTTGHPKGVQLTQRNVCMHALAAMGELSITDADRWAHIAPLFHLADAWATFAVTWAGGAHVLLPKFTPSTALDLLERERATMTNLVPTMLNLMVREPNAGERDWRALRLLLSGGAPIAPVVVRDVVRTFGCEYVQTYGMTESSPYLTLSIPPRRTALEPEAELQVRCKTGRAFATIELRVVDERGVDVPSDERSVGEIWVRGETVTPGYWNRPEETRAAFEGDWLKTGDLAVIDPRGYVTIVDRKKDMLLTGGENVYSAEVEAVLYTHPAVLEAAVIGLPDELWGERVHAAIVLRHGAQASIVELVEHCRRSLAGYKLPRSIEFLAALPRTGSGKIKKSELRNREVGSGASVVLGDASE